MGNKQLKHGRVMLEAARTTASPTQQDSLFRGTPYPHEIFDLVTDILADLVLADLKQFPQIPTGPRIDRFGGRENTVLPTRTGKE